MVLGEDRAGKGRGESEEEEEMDGGEGRDVRKPRVEEVFYGAIGEETKQKKERHRGVETRGEVQAGPRMHKL